MFVVFLALVGMFLGLVGGLVGAAIVSAHEAERRAAEALDVAYKAIELHADPAARTRFLDDLEQRGVYPRRDTQCHGAEQAPSDQLGKSRR